GCPPQLPAALPAPVDVTAPLRPGHQPAGADQHPGPGHAGDDGRHAPTQGRPRRPPATPPPPPDPTATLTSPTVGEPHPSSPPTPVRRPATPRAPLMLPASFQRSAPRPALPYAVRALPVLRYGRIRAWLNRASGCRRSPPPPVTPRGTSSASAPWPAPARTWPGRPASWTRWCRAEPASSMPAAEPAGSPARSPRPVTT